MKLYNTYIMSRNSTYRMKTRSQSVSETGRLTLEEEDKLSASLMSQDSKDGLRIEINEEEWRKFSRKSSSPKTRDDQEPDAPPRTLEETKKALKALKIDMAQSDKRSRELLRLSRQFIAEQSEKLARLKEQDQDILDWNPEDEPSILEFEASVSKLMSLENVEKKSTGSQQKDWLTGEEDLLESIQEEQEKARIHEVRDWSEQNSDYQGPEDQEDPDTEDQEDGQ